MNASRARSVACLVPCNELIGNVIQIIADELRLRAYAQDVVADTLDQRGVPARGDGTERIPGVAGDQAELGRLGAELFST